MRPYPYYANMEKPEDALAMARWLGCIVEDPSYLHTIWWKPRASANLVIVEVSREFPSIERLLGEHNWAKFLLKPRPEDRPLSSKAYFSFYRTADHLLREGWKQLDFEDDWFRKWVPENEMIRYPYPRSTWCDLPPESPTTLYLCLNIPRDLFGLGPPKAAQTKAPPLVPGSAAWVAANGGGASAPAPSGKKQSQPAKSAWNKPLLVSTPASAATSKPSTPKPAAMNPLFPEDSTSTPLGDLGDASILQHIDWADEVEEEERAQQAAEDAKAGPLSAGDQARVYPPPPSDDGDEEDGDGWSMVKGKGRAKGPFDDDDEADYDPASQAIWCASHGLPVISAEDQKRMHVPLSPNSPPQPQRKRGPDSGYAGGTGRSDLEAANWTCPTHGPLRLCQIGICPDAKDAKRRLERAKERGGGQWRPRDNLSQWSTGGPKMEVRAVGGGGSGGAWGGKGSARAKSSSRGPGGSASEGGAWRGASKTRSALGVR
ncbi:hypothetical protein AURDEDRAFT_113611 [Auricularia subglabra TFB-10046 SS5]|nr:hypothetical protein AURDEDRAFT_113611 [Auricularia subglabra TFB-10046 SS5]